MTAYFWIAVIIAFVIISIFIAGTRIIRPSHRSLVERLGPYNRFARPGFQWIIPVIETLHAANAAPHEIITFDNVGGREQWKPRSPRELNPHSTHGGFIQGVRRKFQFHGRLVFLLSDKNCPISQILAVLKAESR